MTVGGVSRRLDTSCSPPRLVRSNLSDGVVMTQLNALSSAARVVDENSRAQTAKTKERGQYCPRRIMVAGQRLFNADSDADFGLAFFGTHLFLRHMSSVRTVLTCLICLKLQSEGKCILCSRVHPSSRTASDKGMGGLFWKSYNFS